MKLNFHCAKWLILAKSLLSSAAELSLLCSTENKEVSWADNLVLDDNSSAKSFMYIKKIVVLGSNLVGLLRYHWFTSKLVRLKLLSVFCFLKNVTLSLKARQLCHFVLNLKIIPSCHTLPNAFEISMKTFLILNPSSNDLYISCIIEKSWLTQESPGSKPDWFCEIRPLLIKNGNISLRIQ